MVEQENINAEEGFDVENNSDTMEPFISAVKNPDSLLDTENELGIDIGSFKGEFTGLKVKHTLNDFKEDKAFNEGSNSTFNENTEPIDDTGRVNNEEDSVDDDGIISYAPASSGFAAKVTAIVAAITTISASPLIVQLFTGVEIGDVISQLNTLINKLIPWVGGIVIMYVLVKGAKELMKQKSFIDNNNNLADKTKNNVVIKAAIEDSPKSWRNAWGWL